MSLESWIAEFYPTPASTCTQATAVEHSLRKWVGLRKENLERHGLQKYGRISIVGKARSYESDEFFVSGPTCALCCVQPNNNCDGCPVVAVTGNNCDGDILVGGRLVEDEDDEPSLSAYQQWCKTGDPEPMIAVLEKCREWKPVSEAGGVV